jgi:hypothetical protein
MATGAMRHEPARVPVREDGDFRPRTPTYGWLRWCLPDVAMAVACVTLFYCLFLFQGYQKLFRDSDAGWHIRTGEAILQTGRLPRTDPYSFTREGAAWFAWEWAADVAVGAVHRAGGPGGVALFYATTIAAGAWLWFRLHWAMGGNFLLACAMAPLMLSTCNIHWLARPHVIGWLFLMSAVWFAERHRGARGWHGLATVAVVTALWANVHASFFFAPIVALIYAAGASLSRAIWTPQGDASPRWYLRAAAVSALAGLANPYGWGLYRHVFDYLRNSELLARVGEFQSFDFHADGSAQILAALLIAMCGGVLALGRRRPEHFMLAVLLTALGLRSARALPLVALVLLPIANGAITESLADAAARLNRRARLGLEAFTAYSGRLRAWDSGFHGLAVAPIAVCLCWIILQTPTLRARTGFPPDQFPVAAYSHIPDGARLFASDKFGGYLIYRSAGSRKVFFDGRSDLYGAEFLKQYARLVQARPGWPEIWDRYGFTHALLPHDAPLVAALQQAGWTTVYRDQTATLLAIPVAHALVRAASRLIGMHGGEPLELRMSARHRHEWRRGTHECVRHVAIPAFFTARRGPVPDRPAHALSLTITHAMLQQDFNRIWAIEPF